MEKLYTASVKALGGRDGHIKSDDNILDLELKKPTALGGEGGATNPEQLFAAAWGACYLGALGSVAQREGIDTTSASANVHVSFNKDGNAFLLSAQIDVNIPGISLEQSQQLADKAHRACPYSKATKGNIEAKVVAV